MKTAQIFTVALLTLGATKGAVTKYNVLFIVVDDLKPTLGAYGDVVAQTPYIDKLLTKGARFENAHSQKSECAPSRQSMITGHRNDYLKMWGFDEQFREIHSTMVTFPGFLRSEGYRTESVGKVVDNRYYSDANQGDICKDAKTENCSFDYVRIPKMIYDDKEKMCEGRSAMRWPTFNPKVDQSNSNKDEALVWEFDNALEDRHIDYCVSEIAQDRLKLLAKDTKPFFLAVGFSKPHMAWVAPSRDFDLYRQIPDHMLEPPPDLQTESDNIQSDDFWGDNNAMSRVDSNSELQSFKGWETVSPSDRSRAYYACTSFVDEQIGRLLKVFEEDISASVRNNTVILFWGDHGFHLGDHNVWGKKTVYEQATRLPLAIIPPEDFLTKNPDVRMQIEKGLFSTSPVDSVDIYPTVLDMMGYPKPTSPALAGTSLVPILRDPEAFPRIASVSQYESYSKDSGSVMGYSVRTKYFCLIVYLSFNSKTGSIKSLDNPQGVQLYRYLQPGNFEAVDLANDLSFKKVVDEMLKLMRNPKTNGLPDDNWTHLYDRDSTTPFDSNMYLPYTQWLLFTRLKTRPQTFRFPLP